MRIVLPLLAACLAAPTLPAQTVQTVHEQITQAWRVRQDKVRSAEFQIIEHKLYPKGSFSDVVNMAAQFNGHPIPAGPPVPAEDLHCTNSLRFVLDGKNVRTESKGVQWSGADFRDVSRITILDGQVRQELEIGLPRFPTGHGSVTKNQTDYFEAKGQSSRPLMWCYRGVMPKFKSFFVDDLEPLGKAVCDGRPCERFVIKGDDGAFTEYWLDPARDWVVVRQAVVMAARHHTQLDVVYEPNPECGWVPKTWTFRHVVPKDKIATTEKYRVANYTINLSVPAAEFKLAFPAGTQVRDDNIPTDRWLIAQSDGGYATETGESLPGDRRRMGIYVALGGAALICAVVVLLLRRMLARRTKPIPS